MAVCSVALAVVVLCVGACIWIVVRDARQAAGGFTLTKGGRPRWSLYLLAIAATLAVVFAAEGGC